MAGCDITKTYDYEWATPSTPKFAFCLCDFRYGEGDFML